MPIIFGIATLALLTNGIDQSGVDPQIDKQYAIVKPGERVTPAVAQTNTSTTTEDAQASPAKPLGQSVRGDYQEGSAPLPGYAISFQAKASTTAPGQSIRIELPSQAATGPTSPQASSRYLAVPATPSLFGQRAPMLPGMTIFGSDNLSRLKGMDRQVSVQFTNASASDVLKWLTKQNVNFVANVDKLPKSKITMNVSHVPLSEALETVAESLGGSWQVKGSTLMFRTGMFQPAMPFSPAKVGAMGKTHLEWQDFPQTGEMKSFSKMDESQLKAFEKSMSDLKGFKFDGKSFKEIDPKALAEMKSFKGFSQDGKAFAYKMDPKQLEELKSHGMMQDGKPFNFQWDPKTLGEMKSWGDFKGFKNMKGFTFKKIDVEKFKKSLSTSQKDLMKKQGYLKFSDLTEAQRTMLFDKPSAEMAGDFTFVFGSDDQKITIKSK